MSSPLLKRTTTLKVRENRTSRAQKELDSIILHFNAELTKRPAVLTKSLIPITNSADFLPKIEDGRLLGLYVSRIPSIAPFIDLSLLNRPGHKRVKEVMNVYQKTENLNLVLSAITSSGFRIVNLGAEDFFREEGLYLVLGMLRRLISMYLINKIAGSDVPPTPTNTGTTQREEAYILQAVNTKLSSMNLPGWSVLESFKECTDCVLYVSLLREISEEEGPEGLEHPNEVERAECMLAYAGEIGVNCGFVNALDVTKGDVKKHSALMLAILDLFVEKEAGKSQSDSAESVEEIEEAKIVTKRVKIKEIDIYGQGTESYMGNDGFGDDFGDKESDSGEELELSVNAALDGIAGNSDSSSEGYMSEILSEELDAEIEAELIGTSLELGASAEDDHSQIENGKAEDIQYEEKSETAFAEKTAQNADEVEGAENDVEITEIEGVWTVEKSCCGKMTFIMRVSLFVLFLSVLGGVFVHRESMEEYGQSTLVHMRRFIHNGEFNQGHHEMEQAREEVPESIPEVTEEMTQEVNPEVTQEMTHEGTPEATSEPDSPTTPTVKETTDDDASFPVAIRFFTLVIPVLFDYFLL